MSPEIRQPARRNPRTPSSPALARLQRAGARAFLGTANLWETAKRLADREAEDASSTSPTYTPIPPGIPSSRKIGVEASAGCVAGHIVSLKVKWAFSWKRTPVDLRMGMRLAAWRAGDEGMNPLREAPPFRCKILLKAIQQVSFRILNNSLKVY